MNKALLYSPKHLFLPDNLKAVAMFAVCYAHLLHLPQTPAAVVNIFTLILIPLGMPFFSFLSGYYDKNYTSASDINTVGVMKMFCLYFVAFYLLYPIGVITKLNEGAPLSAYLIRAVDFLQMGVLWYLVALALWRVGAPYVMKLKYPFLLLIPLGCLCVFFPEKPEIMLDIRAFFKYIPLYFLGMYIKWEHIMAIRTGLKKYLVLAATLMLVAASFLLKKHLGAEHIRVDENCGNWPIMIIMYLIYLATCTGIIFCAAGFMSGRKLPIITKFGTNCLGIYIFHVYGVGILSAYVIYPLITGAPFAITAPLQALLIFLTMFVFSRDFFVKRVLPLSGKLYNLIAKPQAASIKK